MRNLNLNELKLFWLSVPPITGFYGKVSIVRTLENN